MVHGYDGSSDGPRTPLSPTEDLVMSLQIDRKLANACEYMPNPKKGLTRHTVVSQVSEKSFMFRLITLFLVVGRARRLAMIIKVF